jgi:hypothetical protein
MTNNYFYATKTLLHFEGANNGTVFTDEKGKTYGHDGSGAVTSTAEYRYGSSSGQFNATSYLYTSTVLADFAMGTGDFTIELSLKTSSAVLSRLFELNNTNGYYLDMLADGTLTFGIISGASFNATPTIVNDNAWHDIKVQRSGSTIYIHIDGVLRLTGSSSAIFGGSASLFYIGRTSVNDRHYIGFMDEFRIIRGIAVGGSAIYTPGPFSSDYQDLDSLRKTTVRQTNLYAAKSAASIRFRGL